MTERPLVLLLVIGGVVIGGYLVRALAARRRARNPVDAAGRRATSAHPHFLWTSL